nr:unnamed protein product [Callosobruchus chinensis]
MRFISEQQPSNIQLELDQVSLSAATPKSVCKKIKRSLQILS